LLEEFYMVIFLVADPYSLEHNDWAWRDEKANLNLLADFISTFPKK